MNSSYVLISIILSVASERMKSTSSSCPVKYIIYLDCDSKNGLIWDHVD